MLLITVPKTLLEHQSHPAKNKTSSSLRESFSRILKEFERSANAFLAP
jgi:hypothetical protein